MAAVDDEVRNDAEDERGREARDGEERAAGGGVSAEIEGEAADAGNEDGGDDEEVLVVSEVDALEHLETGDRDEAVESYAGAAHNALGYGVDYGYEGGEEGENHAAHGGGEDGDDGGVSGDGYAADALAVGGVGGSAEDAADYASDAVADEGLVKAGIGDEVAVDDVSEILVVGDVLSELNYRDGNEGEGYVADGGTVKRILSVGLDGLEEGELRVVDDGGELEGAEGSLEGVKG